MSASFTPSHPPFTCLAELERLVAAFEKTTLPRAEWTHRAHLAVAAWYLARHSSDQATPLIQNGILKLNAALGIVSDADSGYHETITQFYIGMIAHHLRTAGANLPLVAAVNLLLTARGQAGLPLEYYGRDLLFSRAARARCLPPDLKPFEWAAGRPGFNASPGAVRGGEAGRAPGG